MFEKLTHLLFVNTQIHQYSFHSSILLHISHTHLFVYTHHYFKLLLPLFSNHFLQVISLQWNLSYPHLCLGFFSFYFGRSVGFKKDSFPLSLLSSSFLPLPLPLPLPHPYLKFFNFVFRLKLLHVKLIDECLIALGNSKNFELLFSRYYLSLN